MIKNNDRDIKNFLLKRPESLDLLHILSKFKGKKVLVIGEGILDSYLYGNSHQLCREAPVPVISLTNTQHSPGGAANTAVSISLLGAEVTFMTVLGNDQEGRVLQNLLNHHHINTDHILLAKDRSTLFKQRIVSDNQMLLRIDKGTRSLIEKKMCTELSVRFKKIFSAFEAVVISDYASGLFVPALKETIIASRNSGSALIALDARSLFPYTGAGFDVIKPNYNEALKFLSLPEAQGSERVKQIISHGDSLLKKSKASIAAVTLDKDGSVILEKNHRPYRIYARELEHPNTAGAGDTFISALVLSLISGADSSVSAEIASLAAAIAIGKKETTVTCSDKELTGYLTRQNKEIMNLAELTSLKAFYRSQGLRIIFTNGCFDILHRGHIYFLNQCKSLGDVLFVGVNDDESIRRIKGRNRPLNTLNDRTQILQSLSCVDHVISFKGTAPINIINILKPDIFVKGNNHRMENLPEIPLIKQQGGEICLLPYLYEYSTTKIIERVKTDIDFKRDRKEQ